MKRGVQYFIDTYDYEHEAWPQKENDASYFEKDLPWNWGNPGAEIIGYLWQHRELVDEEFLGLVTDIAMRHLRQIEDRVSAFADLCFLRCARFIDKQYRNEIIQKIAARVALFLANNRNTNKLSNLRISFPIKHQGS